MMEILKNPSSLQSLPIIMNIFQGLNVLRVFKNNLSLRIEVHFRRILFISLHGSIPALSNEFLVEVYLLIMRRLTIMFIDNLLEVFLPLTILDGRVVIQVLYLV
jgi:hypothetical protein